MACTSSCGRTAGESSVDEAACRASRTACAHVCPQAMAPGLSGERRAVIAGIVLGEDEGLSDGLRANFRASGLYHLLAVSGQNVALIAGGAMMLVWLIGLSRFVGQIVALVAIGGYVLAVGWQPSVVRAGVAGALASLAWLASRPSDRWCFLLARRGSLARVEPVLAPGRWLPAVVRGRRGDLRRRPSPPADARRVSGASLARRSGRDLGACGLATAPILLAAVRVVPLYSIPANALAAPVVAPLLGIALITAVVAPVAPPLAAVARLGRTAGWPRTSRCALGWSAGCRMQRIPLMPRSRSPRSFSAPPISSLGSAARGGGRARRSPRSRLHRGGCVSSGSAHRRLRRAAHHVPGRRPGRRGTDPGPGRSGPGRRRAA